MQPDDNEFLRTMRARALYANYKNSLVEWTISQEWLTPPRVCDTRGDRLARGQKVSGITSNTYSGEFDAR